MIGRSRGVVSNMANVKYRNMENIELMSSSKTEDSKNYSFQSPKHPETTNPSHPDKTPLSLEEFPMEVKERLKTLVNARKRLDEPFSQRKTDDSTFDITKFLRVVQRDSSKKPQQEEAVFIMRSFQDPPCLQFKDQPNSDNNGYCSTCGETRDFHKRDDNHQSLQNGVGLSSEATSHPPQASTSSKETAAADGEARDADHLPKHGFVGGASKAMNRPALTFGSVQIPRQFVSNRSSFTEKIYLSKYLKFCDNEDAARHLWHLMTKIWKIKVPSVVFSVTGGAIPDKCLEAMKIVTTAIKKITSQAECWFISDGLNHGASKHLSKELQSKGPKDDKRKHESPVFVCATHWGSLHHKELLFGISLPCENESSQYFYSIEYELFEDSRIVFPVLNPYQAVYLLLDNGLSKAGDCAQLFQHKFEQLIKKTAATQICSLESAKKINLEVTLPIVTLVIGGDDQTLDQVLYSVEHNNPVIIVNKSGDIPSMLSELFYKLEDAHPRTWNEKAEWTGRETEAFEDYIRKDWNLSRIFKCPQGLNVQEAVRWNMHVDVKDILRKIMAKRYYITVIVPSFEKEKSLHCRILQGIYKGYNKPNGIAIALMTGTHDFIEAIFLRDVDPKFTNEDCITTETLNWFHQENLCSEEPISKVLRFMCKEEFIIVNLTKSILPIVGRILHMLLGPRYKVMYQKEKHPKFSRNEDATMYTTDTKDSNELKNDTTTADTKEDVEFMDNEEQMWHLFLWSILSAKPDMTQFFLMQTSAPLGASLLAFKLYSRLAFYSNKVYEEELTTTLRSAADHFQEVAIKILDNMYNAEENEAYRVLVSELPFDLGNYVTPLLIADDSEAKDFMVQPCCQTYLQKVWKGNMTVETPDWKSFPVLPPLVVIPWIRFDGTPLKRLDEIKKEIEEEKKKKEKEKKKVKKNRWALEGKEDKENEDAEKEDEEDEEAEKEDEEDEEAEKEEGKKERGMFWKIQSYYTAPVTKFHRWMFAYIGFLTVLSYYVLTDLKPFTSIVELTVSEWIVIAWELTLIVEEIIQLITIPAVRLKFNLDDVKLSSSTWSYYKRLRTHLYAIELYVDSGRWNSVDLAMVLLFIASFTLRFLLPLETFQMVRIIFAVTIIVCYFRLLRYLSVLKKIGPRILAIQMMLTELLKFLVVLVLFVVSFGVAFQAILNPNQTPSWTTFADILYRPYWEMFGELFLDEEMMEMGRPVGDVSCRKMSKENGTGITCYEWAAPVLLGSYLLISSVLLLNLLVAIFSMTYDDIAGMSDKVSKYNRYSLIQEFFYLVWLPPPLNILAHLYNCIIFTINGCEWKKRHERQDCFRLKPLPRDHELQKEATKNVPSPQELEKKTKEALEKNSSDTSERETSKVDRDDLIKALTDKRVIEAMTRRIVHGITHKREG